MTERILSDGELIKTLKMTVKKERVVLGEIINLLAEVERRKLYCGLKYPSLFEYCVNELGYSRDQAYRRISAMRLAIKNSTVKKEIEQGNLSLSGANQLGTLFNELNREKKSLNTAESEKLIKDVIHLSRDEAQDRINKEREKLLGDSNQKKVSTKTIIREQGDQVRISFTISREQMQLIKKLQGLYGKFGRPLDFTELIELMIQITWQHKQDELRPRRSSKVTPVVNYRAATGIQAENRQKKSKPASCCKKVSEQKEDPDATLNATQQNYNITTKKTAKHTTASRTVRQDAVKDITPNYSGPQRATAKVISSKVTSTDGKLGKEVAPCETTAIKRSRYISKTVRYAALKRAEYKCQNCGSTTNLEFDHIVPYAVGGDNRISNIRVLCRNCNMWAAVRFYGANKIEQYSKAKR